MIEFLGVFTQSNPDCPRSVRWSSKGFVACDACLLPTQTVGVIETARETYELCVPCYRDAERDLESILSKIDLYNLDDEEDAGEDAEEVDEEEEE